MSTTETVTRKKRASDTVKRTSEDDHRRKRRNRTTQSCLNCHTSKRMCDRKRPCGRCTQLGLTGLCVYEVDDPNQRNDTSDEKARLQKRVAELESVIRELKNKPHPRWAQSSASDTSDKATSSTDAKSRSSSTSNSQSDDSASSSPRASSVQLQYPPSSRASPLNTMLSASSSSTFSSPSPLDTPSPLTLTPVDIAGDHHSLAHGYDFASLLSSCYPDGTGLEGALDSIFDGLIRTDGLGSDSCLMRHEHPEGHCGCLNDTTSYNVVLELSLRLRRAAEILGNYSKHQTSSSCPIHQRIADLDRYTTEALSNINTTSHNFPSYTNHTHSLSTTSTSSLHGPGSTVTRPPSTLTTSATVSPQSLHSGMRSWDYKSSSAYPSPPCEDTFMSWEPHRRSTEQWSPSANL